MRHAGTSLVLTFLAIITTAWSQPHGWPCDYGFRPGNAWFYSSIGDPHIWSFTALHDSIGGDGAYWIYLESPKGTTGYWYRIDSACTFDLYYHPSDTQFQRVFKAAADLGDSWLVDTNEFGSSEYARIVAVRGSKGHRSTEVLHYWLDERGGVAEPGSRIWSEGIGITDMEGLISGMDELAGRVIDGVHYGRTSDVDEVLLEEGKHVAVHPLPAAGSATLMIAAGSAQSSTIMIHDMLGRPLHRNHSMTLTAGVNMIPLDLAGLAPGTYLITAQLGKELLVAPLIVAP